MNGPEGLPARSPDGLADFATAEALRAAADALLDPQVLLEAARDSIGNIVDFVYREVNQATCDYLGMAREEILGRGVVETMPGLKGALLADYIRCLQTGEPLILNDFAYDNEVFQHSRRYDIRATRATSNSITLTWRDITDRFHAAQALAHSHDLLRAATDAMFDPQAVVEVTKTPAGETDLICRDVNNAFCDYLDQTRSDIVGQSLLKLFPNVISSGLMARYVHCAETGESVILNDVEYFTEFIDERRRFDIRAAQVDVGLIALTFRDTTARFQAAQRLADSEQKYRLLAENTTDMVFHGRDGKFVWVSPSTEAVLGAPPEHWIGRDMTEIAPQEDRAAVAERLRLLEAGRTIQRRSRVVSLDGITHWVHVHAAPFYDADHRQAGFIAAVRVIDDEVAAEAAAVEARRERAEADARYRQIVESARVATASSSPDGRFQLVNPAMCDLFGYDAQTMLTMNWRDITHPDDLDKAAGVVADLIAGREDSVRLTGCYIHADGHRIWGDVSVTCTRTRTGEPEQLVAQIVDVTVRVNAEQRLAESEERYRLLAENTGDVITHVRDGRVVWTSPSVEAVLGAPPEYWIGREVQEVVPPEDRAAFAERQAILAHGGAVQQRVRVVSLDGATHWMHLHSTPFYDADGCLDGFIGALRLIDNEAALENAAEEARQRQAEADALFREAIDSANIGMGISQPDGTFTTVNPALCEMLGYDAETLRTKTWIELTAPASLAENLANRDDIVSGRTDSYRMIKQFIHADGHLLTCDLSVGCVRNPDGTVSALVYHIIDITAEVGAREQLEEARRKQAAADALYRRSMESTAVGACLAGPEGAFYEVNEAMCEFFGYNAEELKTKSWIDLTDPDYLDLTHLNDMLAGRIDAYRMKELKFVHASGRAIWGDLYVACLREPDGSVGTLVGQIVDISEEVKARERLAQREQENRALIDRLRTEMASAADYMASILPGDLHGDVEITSRYLPAMELGGDGFYYRWLDGDHLQVYILDVSGHGVRPALLSASVNNLIRSGSLPPSMLLHPEGVVNELNRLFRMDEQGETYFTIWYGVYEASTRTLSYASAGHPPALAIRDDGETSVVTVLSAPSVPIGVFDDTVYTSATVTMPVGTQLLIYSDGVYALNDAAKVTHFKDFIDLCASLAARPDWSLDTLVNELVALSPRGEFDDDCAAVLLKFR